MVASWLAFPVALLLFSAFFVGVFWTDAVFRWAARLQLRESIRWEYRPEKLQELQERLRLLERDPAAFTRKHARFFLWRIIFMKLIGAIGLVMTTYVLWRLLLAAL